jgi:hypothetical protein
VRVFDAHSGPTFGQPLAHAATGLTSAGGLTFASNGDLLVGDGFVQAPGQMARIARVSPDAPAVLNTFGISNMGMLSSPTSLLALHNGDVLAVDLLGNYIARFDSTGNNFQPFAVVPPEIPPQPWPVGANLPSNSPSQLAFDPDGNLILSVLGFTGPPGANSGALIRYDLSGNIIDPDNDETPNEPIASGLEPIGGIAWTASAATLAGDYDGNNSVGSSDYAKWRADFGKLVAPGNGADGSGNGVIDAADYVLWRKFSGAGLGGFGEIPEPGALVLSLAGLAALATFRRQRSA